MKILNDVKRKIINAPGIEEIILEQTEDNCNIFKNDMVYVIREKDELLDIELKDGDYYE